MKAETLGGAWLLATALVFAGGCGREAPQASAPHSRRLEKDSAPYQSEVEEGLGAAVMILIDTSGSMKELPPGGGREKNVVARAAVERMLAATDEFIARRPDFAVKVGLMHFSSRAWMDLAIRPYDRELIQATLDRIPDPGGGTAIGDALAMARPELYRSGVYRKYIIVVTDGENTSGALPQDVAREIHEKSLGGVEIHFVAFDTDPAKFAFLNELGGGVVTAQNAEELELALTQIYEGRILAEAVDYGETELSAPVR